MNRLNRLVLGAAVVGCGAFALAGCDADEDPEVRIVSPSAGSTLSLGQDMKVTLTITANDFELKAPGECKGERDCGVAYVNIDGDACNQPGKPFNNMLGDSTLGQDFFVEALFQFCPSDRRFGRHDVKVSLHDENGAAVIGEGDLPAEAMISITTTM